MVPYSLNKVMMSGPLLIMYRKKYIPDFICGDLDSAKQDVLRFYEREVSKQCAFDDVDTGTHVGLYCGAL